MEFKEFAINGLFKNISRGNISNQNNLKVGNTMLITQLEKNNGVTSWIDREDYKVFNNSIVIGRQNGSVHYINKEFASTDGVLVLNKSDFFELNENLGLYISALIKKHMWKFSYSYTVSAQKLKSIFIKLPVKDNGNIDFEYIETFMQNIKEKVIQNLEEKTEKEINILTEKLNINIKETLPEYKKPDHVKPFKVEDLFDQYSNTKNKTKFEKQKEKTNIFNLPATSSTTTNNGLGYYVKKEDHNPLKNMLTVASNGNAGKMFYQTNEFAIAQDSYALKLKETDSLEVHLYIKTILEKKILPLYDWSYKATWNKVKKEIIYLPTKEDGSPNYQYMLETGGGYYC